MRSLTSRKSASFTADPLGLVAHVLRILLLRDAARNAVLLDDHVRRRAPRSSRASRRRSGPVAIRNRFAPTARARTPRATGGSARVQAGSPHSQRKGVGPPMSSSCRLSLELLVRLAEERPRCARRALALARRLFVSRHRVDISHAGIERNTCRLARHGRYRLARDVAPRLTRVSRARRLLTRRCASFPSPVVEFLEHI